MAALRTFDEESPVSEITTSVYGFVGVRRQGSPMVQRMIDCDLQPWLWARRSEVTDRYQDTAAQLAPSLADLGAACDVIGLCLYDQRAIDATLFEPDGLLSKIRPGTVLAMHSTVGPDYVESLAKRVSEHGVRIVDAPVSGGDKALTRQLLVMAGGDRDDLDRCAPMFDTYAERVVELGAVGTTQAAKTINNALMTAIAGMVFDAFDVGAALGIDRAAETRSRSPPIGRAWMSYDVSIVDAADLGT